MKLYILRHGEAAATAPGGRGGDSQRPLTPKGEAQVIDVARNSGGRLGSLDQVVSSPYLRARQTAAIMMRSLKDRAEWQHERELLISPTITPDGDLREIGAFIEALDSEELMLVSHQPLVSHLITFLTDSELPGSMGTANLAALELSAFARGGGELLWFERPGL